MRIRTGALMRAVTAACTGLAVVHASGCVHAQGAAQFPNKPVKTVLPFGPGGVADVTMRLVAGKLSERIWQQFVIENKPGAGAINAAMTVKSATPDGYTLLLNGNGSALSASLFKSLPFDIAKDFTQISVLAQFDVLLAVKTDGEIDSIKTFVEVAKAKPGKLNLGTVAAGSTQNLAAEMFKVVTGIEAAIVTFRTTPDLVTALMRGDVQVGFDYLAAFSSGVQDNKLKIIAAGGEKRSPLTPNVPTVVESGWPEYVVTSWNGISAPAGTPNDIVVKLSREINAVLKLPDVQMRSTQLGMEAVGSTPDGMTKRLNDDIVRWRGIITKLGLQK